MLNKVERPSPCEFSTRSGAGWGGSAGVASGLDKVRRMKRRDARRNEPAPSSFCVVLASKLNIRRDLRANERAAEINPRLLCYPNEIVEGSPVRLEAAAQFHVGVNCQT